MSQALQPTLADIRAAAERVLGAAIRTPLVRLEGADDGPEIWLKLETLQPIGSFKLRGAANAIRAAGTEALAAGVYTASAGNMAQGVAWVARELGIPCSVIVPAGAPAAKREAVEGLGGRVVEVAFDDWWRVLVEHRYPGMDGLFVHPVVDRLVMAGNGTIGLEILAELPEVDLVLVPWGGGGLACGIAAGLAELAPRVGVVACEVDGAAPLARSLELGRPCEIEPRRSFVDGIGGKGVLPEMWTLGRRLLAGSRVVSLAAVAAAIRLLVRRARVVAEGAGATPVAAALSATREAGKMVCVVSGGNLDADVLAAILRGEIP